MNPTSHIGSASMPAESSKDTVELSFAVPHGQPPKAYVHECMHALVQLSIHLIFLLQPHDLQAGMSRFPGNAYLMILHANYTLQVQKDAQAARTQLALAGKSNPNIIER